VKPGIAQGHPCAASADCSSVPAAFAVAPASSPARPSFAVASDCVDLTRSDSSAKLIYLFSGPVGLVGGFDQCIHNLGHDVAFFDLEVDSEHDLCDDVLFAKLCDDIKIGKYDKGALMSPPCSTFACVRSLGGAGQPEPLRGPLPPELYGLRGLRTHDAEKVRIGTSCALRCAQVVGLLHTPETIGRRIPRLWEQPALREGYPHMFNLPEVQDLLKFPGVRLITLDQCMYGGGVPLLIRGSLAVRRLYHVSPGTRRCSQ
jgi:hypothetical protein